LAWLDKALSSKSSLYLSANRSKQ